MNKRTIAVVSLLLLTCCRNASAQPSQCPRCQVTYTFGNCAQTVLNDPPNGEFALTGTVVAVKHPQCWSQIRVDVTRSSATPLPATIDIQLGPCMAGARNVGMTITGLISATPRQVGAYSARPDSECWKDGRPR